MTSPARPKAAPSTQPPPADDPPRKRGPGPLTQRRLENIAKFYIERFATTATHLKRVLHRRAEKALREHGDQRSDCGLWIDEIVARFVRCDLVNDERYASGRVEALRRLGKSPGKIRALLAAKGVDRALIDTAIEETALTITGEDAAFQAALSFARRRRLGPYGERPGDAETRRKKISKDLSALARAGFSYAIAKRALAGNDDD